MRLSRYLRMPIHQALIASGGFLFFIEMAHPQVPFWADLVYTIGFILLLNGMAAAIDFLNTLEAVRFLNKDDEED